MKNFKTCPLLSRTTVNPVECILMRNKCLEELESSKNRLTIFKEMMLNAPKIDK